MAQLIVTNSNSSGAGSLADAVAQANATAEADNIVFSKSLAGSTIALSGELLLINEVTISGDTNKDGDADITIDTTGGGIRNQGGNTAALKSLVLTGAPTQATGVYSSIFGSAVVNGNGGHLSLTYVSVAHNSTAMLLLGSSNVATVANLGTLTVSQSAFASNENFGTYSVSPGAYSYTGPGGNAGTIINYNGVLTLDRTNFYLNTAVAGDGGNGAFNYYGGVDYGQDGGNAAGAVLNKGYVSGNYWQSANSATAGSGGIGFAYKDQPRVDGVDGLAGNGLLNLPNGLGMFGSSHLVGTGSFSLFRTGTMNADVYSFTSSTQIATLGGGDVVSARGNSNIDGGAGADVITIDSLFASILGNKIYAPSTVRGGLGNDTIIALKSWSGGRYDGGAGRDTIDFSHDTFNGLLDLSSASFSVGGATFTSFENVIGSKGDDSITGNSALNLLNGFSGDDTIEGGKGADQLDGGDGIDLLSYRHSKAGVEVNLTLNSAAGGDAAGDTIRNFENVLGSAFADMLKGDAGANTISGGAGTDGLNGAGGNDILDGGGGGDTLDGGSGDDMLDGAGGDDTMAGGSGVDHLSGGDGNDLLQGEDGNDILSGDAGADRLKGGKGADTLTGGDGNDLFSFMASDFAAGVQDVIADFHQSAINFDTIRLQGAAGDYTLSDDGSGNLLITHLASGGTILVQTFSVAQVLDQIAYF